MVIHEKPFKFILIKELAIKLVAILDRLERVYFFMGLKMKKQQDESMFSHFHLVKL